MSLNEKIKYYRLKNNMLQKDVANILNISRRQYIKYETGEVVPKIKTLEVLSSVYNITLFDFFN